MKLTYKTLAGEHTIEVAENVKEEVRQAIAAQFNVHPYRVRLFPWENVDYGVVIQPPQWKVLDWIPLENVSWQSLSANPRAITLLEHYPEKIDWSMLSMNPEGIPMLLEHRDHIVWHQLAANPSPDAIPLLEEFLEHGGECDQPLFWSHLSAHPHALPLLEKHIESINIVRLMRDNSSPEVISFLQRVMHLSEEEIAEDMSHNPYAIHLIEKHIDHIDWSKLCSNPKALHLLEQHVDHIDWYTLHSSPHAVALFEKHPDKMVVWSDLSANEHAVPLLRKYPDHINWFFLCSNQSIAAMELLEQHLDQLGGDHDGYWSHVGQLLSNNPYALPLLSRHPQFIQWHILAHHPEIFEWAE